MKLSVFIPYYNGEQWVAACLDSLLRQDLSPEEYEMIVVDDGSTHNIDTLMSYVERYPNIHYLHQTNQKHAAARNYGLTIAKGEYVFFCDCDDFVADRVFGCLYEMAAENRADVLLFNVRRLEEGEAAPAPKRNFDPITVFDSGLSYMSQTRQFRGGIWQFLIRRAFMAEKQLQFAPEMINREEHLFFLQMMLAAGKVMKVDVDVYYYVQHPTSWVHLTGKKEHTEGYIRCMVVFLRYLHQTRLDLASAGSVSTECLEAMERAEAQDAISILSNSFRYTSVKDNVGMIRQLRNLGYYPIRERASSFDWLRRLMNSYPLWMSMCVVYHSLPRAFSEKVVAVLTGRDKRAG